MVRLALVMLLVAWTGVAAAQEPMRLPVDPAMLHIVGSDGIGKGRFEIEIARTSRERSMGLMHRTDLPRNRAMLFVFDSERELSFWMQNTPTPLDIIFADTAGRVVSIARDTTPISTESIRSGAPARYALEVHAGLTGMLGIGPGDVLQHPAIGG